MKTLFAFLLSAIAATAAPAEVSFYCFQYSPGSETVFLQTGTESFTDLRLSTANIVGPVRVETKDGPLEIRGTPRTDEKGLVFRPLLGSAKLPSSGKAVVILIPTPAGSPMPYHCVAFDHTGNGFPLGSYQVINLSPFPIRGSIGKNAVEMKSGAVAPLKPTGTPGTSVPTRFEFAEKGAWNLLTETRSAIRDDRRWILCIYQDPVTKRMNLRSIPDRTIPLIRAEASAAPQ